MKTTTTYHIFLSDLADEPLERESTDKMFCRFLKASDLAESDGARTEAKAALGRKAGRGMWEPFGSECAELAQVLGGSLIHALGS
jgi:hypothetical protein